MWSPTHAQVTVQRARNLQNKGRKGTNDAFVLIQLGKEKFQTSVKEKTINPEWYEECDLTLIGRDSDIVLTVFHRNVFGLDEFLGQATVSLQGIESFDRPFTKWYSLNGKSEKSEDKNRGEIEVRVAFIVRRCNDTQSLNDLSFKKKKHSIKNLAASVGHKIQKLPSRSMSLRHLDPRKHLEKLKEKRASNANVNGKDDVVDESDISEFDQVSMKRHGSAYSSTLSLPQSALITSSIQEAESLEELQQQQEEELSDSSNSVDSQVINLTQPPLKKSGSGNLDTKPFGHGEWTNRILLSKESLVARSETNLIDALRSESPIVPARKSKFDTFRHNLRRHTLQLSESPDLSIFGLGSPQKKNKSDILKPESPKIINHSIPEGIPTEILKQYEKMNHQDLVVLAVKLQGDLERQRDKILDLENYLDNLLVRVMETTPRILQKPYVIPACQR